MASIRDVAKMAGVSVGTVSPLFKRSAAEGKEYGKNIRSDFSVGL